MGFTAARTCSGVQGRCNHNSSSSSSKAHIRCSSKWVVECHRECHKACHKECHLRFPQCLRCSLLLWLRPPRCARRAAQAVAHCCSSTCHRVQARSNVTTAKPSWSFSLRPRPTSEPCSKWHKAAL